MLPPFSNPFPSSLRPAYSWVQTISVGPSYHNEAATATQLFANSNYTIWVWAVTASFNGPESTPLNCSTGNAGVPSEPLNVVATAIGSNTLSVSWARPVDLGGATLST